MNPKQTLADVISETLATMIANGLSSRSVNEFQKICNIFQRFCSERKIEDYTEEMGRQYLEYICVPTPLYPISSIKRHRVSIDRLNCTLNGVPWKPRRKSSAIRKECCYDELLNDYTVHLIRSGKMPRYVKANNLSVYRFLSFVEQNECFSLENLSVELIHESFKAATNKTKFRDFIRKFLKYLYTRKLIRMDLSLAVPSTVRKQGVTPVYTIDEVERLLSSINRETEAGKRDYAMTLIAARLGLRVSDIAGLRFDNLHEGKASIEIIQAKTKQPLTLPLLKDVRDAIFDYANHCRQNNQLKHIFLQIGGYEPLSPQGVSKAIAEKFKHSGIDSKNRRRGAHALRASLATALLSEGNNYATIQKTLGHKDIQTVNSYAKTDVFQLCGCALKVPVASGNFLSAIGG